jgi:ribosomal protein S18 acetylase RimI-like enzyme
MAEFDSGDGRWSVKPIELPTLNFHQFEPHVKFSAANEYSNYGRNTHAVDLYSHDPDSPKKTTLGNIQWHKDTGEIINVEVRHKYQRLGVANTMFHEAHKAAREQGLTPPVHSEDRTDMGDAWAKQAGGEVPERMKVPKTFLDRS